MGTSPEIVTSSGGLTVSHMYQWRGWESTTMTRGPTDLMITASTITSVQRTEKFNYFKIVKDLLLKMSSSQLG